MKSGEINDLNAQYPFLSHVLRILSEGGTIDQDSPYWDTYLIARQRGLVHRVGDDKRTITESPRGQEFREKRKGDNT